MPPPTPAAPRAGLADETLTAALTIATSFSAFDEAELLARARRGLRTGAVSRGSVREKLPAAMALALLRPIRLLGLLREQAPLVADLPFTQVHDAAQMCVTLAETPAQRPLRAWLAGSGLAPWTVDQAAWRIHLTRARAARRMICVRELTGLLHGHTVETVFETVVCGGALDGALAVSVGLSDASLVTVPVTDPAASRRRLLHRRDSPIGPLAGWAAAELAELDHSIVLWQPSPFANASMPYGLPATVNRAA